MSARVVIAYSGAKAVSAIVASIAGAHQAEVVTITFDLGQDDDLEDVRSRALAAGAVRAHVLDVREEFARDYILRSLQAGALRDEYDPMPVALARPLVATKLREIVDIEAATGLIETFDTTATLWGRIGSAEAPVAAGLAGLPAHVEIEFERGVPVAINGVALRLVELIESLSVIAVQHGVGRIALGSHLEAPAAVVLHAAHAALERFVLPPDLAALKKSLGRIYADLVWHGTWWTPMRDALDAFNASVQDCVTGCVRIELSKGRHTVLACASPFAGRRNGNGAASIPGAASVALQR